MTNTELVCKKYEHGLKVIHPSVPSRVGVQTHGPWPLTPDQGVCGIIQKLPGISPEQKLQKKWVNTLGGG